MKRDPNPPTGASKAYRESQSRIYKLEAPLFVGVGEGTDNLDFLADPDEVAQAVPPADRPVPKSDSPLLQRLKYEDLPCAHCAWCTETPKTRGACSRSITMQFIMLCCNHLAVHLRQCSRPSWVRNCDCDKGILVPTKSDSPLLQRLKYEDLPCAHCAWCTETPKTRGACSRSITMQFIMLCCNHLAVHLRQCSRPSWVRNCDCDKGILVPTQLTECSSEKE